MKKTFFLLFVISLFSTPVYAETAAAEIRATDDTSPLWGAVYFQDTENGVLVTADLFDAPPGDHGFHVHENGSCEEGGKAAGGHYNPHETDHGHLSKDGIKKAHGGDLGNITVSDDGRGSYSEVVPMLSAKPGPHSVVGKAIIVHEKPDNFGQPTGNAGGRIGCGIIKRAN